MNPFPLLLALGLGDPFVRYPLPGGAELLVLEAPGAPGESVFVSLPHGLLDDRPGAAQESHLLEHFLIRGSEPDGLSVDGLAINGETGGGSLRLEVLAPAERWRDALVRPARWLAVRTLGDEVLAREQQRIGEEEASTARGGFTHKWALAAWSQVVAGGLERAAVHGDPLAARVQALGLRAEELARLGPGARIVAAGPAKAAEVLELVQREYAACLRAPAAEPALKSKAECKSYSAHWDLPAEHELAWIVLPDKQPEDLAAAWVLEQGAWLLLAQSGAGLLQPGQAQAELARLPGLGRALLLSAGGFERARADKVHALLEDVRERLEHMDSAKSWETALAGCRMQLGAAPDFAAQRAQLAGNPVATWIEGQYALNLLALELRTGLSVPRLRELLEKKAGERVARLAAVLAEPARRGSLRLIGNN